MIRISSAMKRDMALIRMMLLAVEANPHGFAPKIEIPGYTQEQIGYHAILLGEAGLAEVLDMTAMSNESPEGSVGRLTWAGHEFLDASRDNQIWNQARDMIGKAGGATLQVWLSGLTTLIQKKLGL